MNFSDDTGTKAETALNLANGGAVLAREAGLPFQPQMGNDCGIDPMTEWLSLMEVVEMLCPVWPVRDTPMRGTDWRL